MKSHTAKRLWSLLSLVISILIGAVLGVCLGAVVKVMSGGY